jgi:cytidine deaminase
MSIDELFEQARISMDNSYSPYSSFKVGTAIKTDDGKIYGGTNIENASLSLTLCAERVAIFKAVSEGHKSFTDLALVSSNGQPIFPCGACRQVLMEFSPEIQIHQEGNDNKSKSLRDLLPNPFGPKDFKNPS